MNMIDFLKNGSGIHIKKKNRGKFTSYCGGKVTDECIRKAKASGNPTLVKRATFADNARHFKYKKGGKAFVSGVSILDSNPDAYKYVKKKYKMHLNGGIIKADNGAKFLSKLWFQNVGNSDLGKSAISLGTQLFNGIKNSYKANKLSSDFDAETNANVRNMNSLNWASKYKQGLQYAGLILDLQNNPDIHYGDIDKLLLAKLIAYSLPDVSDVNSYLALRAKDKQELLSAIQGSGMDFGSLIDLGKGLVSNLKNTNNITNTTTSINTTTPTTFSTPTTDLGNGFSYNLNTGMTYKPNWNSMLKYLFGGKYFLPPIKTKYGYPVYWSDKVPSEFGWANKFLKEHPGVTGFAVGGGAQGSGDEDNPRAIIRNSHSNIITDHNDKRWDGLDEIEAIRHFMEETNYHPNFKISPEQETFRRTNFSEDAPYNTNDDAWRQSIISRILVGDMKGTPEQIKESDSFYEKFRKQKGHGYW